MHKCLRIIVWSLAASSGLAWAAIDLGDFDEYVMRDMDDANKDLGPALGAGNLEAAQADAEVLKTGLDWTEDYFAAKGGAGDAVDLARQGKASLATVFVAIGRKDLAVASAAAREVNRNCTSCHDLYKPLK
jgi:hypothetical protein